MRLRARIEQVNMARPITVSRGTYADHEVVVVELTDRDGRVGIGECCPIAHYQESGDKVLRDLDGISAELETIDRHRLLHLLPPGPARNGVDCALWDLEAKRAGASVWELAGVVAPARQATALTLMMAPADDMAAQARAAADFKTLKLKLGPSGPEAAIEAVRQARPDAVLAVDANEGWTLAQLRELEPVLARNGVVMAEQPLKAGADQDLLRGEFAVPLCADESFHESADLAEVSLRYDFINIKLDKCGGLTEALRIQDRATDFGLKTMVGCMFATSLGIAPALLVAATCDFADLDGPLLLAEDRRDAIGRDGDAYLARDVSIWGRGV